MNSGQTDSKTGGQGGGARAITTADEDKVRAALPASSGFGWYADGKLRAIDGCVHNSPEWHPRVAEAAARAGIVPGPAGWCWAAPVCGECRWNARCTFADKHSGRCSCDVEGEGAPPAGLTAAVIAALPPDGQALAFGPLMRAALDHPACKGRFRMGDEIAGQVRAAVDAAVASGEIEAGEQPGTSILSLVIDGPKGVERPGGFRSVDEAVDALRPRAGSGIDSVTFTGPDGSSATLVSKENQKLIASLRGAGYVNAAGDLEVALKTGKGVPMAVTRAQIANREGKDIPRRVYPDAAGDDGKKVKPRPQPTAGGRELRDQLGAPSTKRAPAAPPRAPRRLTAGANPDGCRSTSQTGTAILPR